jgi:hypothetical protein
MAPAEEVPVPDSNEESTILPSKDDIDETSVENTISAEEPPESKPGLYRTGILQFGIGYSVLSFPSASLSTIVRPMSLHFFTGFALGKAVYFGAGGNLSLNTFAAQGVGADPWALLVDAYGGFNIYPGPSGIVFGFHGGYGWYDSSDIGIIGSPSGRGQGPAGGIKLAYDFSKGPREDGVEAGVNVEYLYDLTEDISLLGVSFYLCVTVK